MHVKQRWVVRLFNFSHSVRSIPPFPILGIGTTEELATEANAWCFYIANSIDHFWYFAGKGKAPWQATKVEIFENNSFAFL